jgi:hypothetical integral membrane protein (TIGR02206 family)
LSTLSEFVTFGTSHVTTLLIITLACIALFPLSNKIAHTGWETTLARTLALIIVIELTVKTIGNAVYGFPWTKLLPLQICDVNALLCAWMLFKRSYGVYQVAYFWAMAASVAAMLTPDLRYDFPHPIFAFFFLGHGLSVVGVLYATWVFGFQPRLRSVGIAIAVTALYAGLMMPLNFLLGMNYLYLRAKPSAPSVLDYMGPWPWYLIGLVVLCVVACFLVYTPFPIARALQTKKSH